LAQLGKARLSRGLLVDFIGFAMASSTLLPRVERKAAGGVLHFAGAGYSTGLH
jgi:hypothetical protein